MSFLKVAFFDELVEDGELCQTELEVYLCRHGHDNEEQKIYPGEIASKSARPPQPPKQLKIDEKDIVRSRGNV